jgi:sulfoquinovosidase
MQLELSEGGFALRLDNGALFARHQEESLIEIGSQALFNEEIVEELIALKYWRVVQQSSASWQVELSHHEDFFESMMLMWQAEQATSISIKCSYAPGYYNKMLLRLANCKATQIYGIGMSDSINLQGSLQDLSLSDNRYHANVTALHLVRQPCYIHSLGYSLELVGCIGGVLDARQEQVLVLEMEGLASSIQIEQAAGLSQLVQRLAGRLKDNLEALQWATRAPIMGYKGPIDVILSKYQSGFGTPLAAIWLQDNARATFPSFGHVFIPNWQIAQSRKDHLKSGLDQLQSQNVPSICYVNGLVAEGTSLFNQGDDLGYFVLFKGFETYLYRSEEFQLAVVDLTNAEAFEWYAQVLADKILSLGVAGLLIDDGAYLPADVSLSSGSSQDCRMHWPLLLAKVLRRAIELHQQSLATLQPILLLATSAWRGSHQLIDALFLDSAHLIVDGAKWSLRASLRSMLSAGMSGYVATASVIGNVQSSSLDSAKASSQLIIRHGELACMSGFFWTQDSNPYQQRDYYNDAAIMKSLRRLAQLFVDLAPYRLQLLQEYQEQALPLMRAMALYDAQLFKLEDQYMLGSQILVAPVLTPDHTHHEVVFPAGKWQHFGSTLQVSGPTTQVVASPLGTPLAFYLMDTPNTALFASAAATFMAQR